MISQTSLPQRREPPKKTRARLERDQRPHLGQLPLAGLGSGMRYRGPFSRLGLFFNRLPKPISALRRSFFVHPTHPKILVNRGVRKRFERRYRNVDALTVNSPTGAPLTSRINTLAVFPL